jgi:hypothetical protein
MDIQALECKLAYKLQHSQIFQSALEMIRGSSKGNIWVVGGTVYRTLADMLYGDCDAPLPSNIDMICDDITGEIILKDGWAMAKTSFGHPRLMSGNVSVDAWPLKEHYWIVKKGLMPTIENYCAVVPLTVQSIAYDYANRRIIGTRGLDALEQKTVAVNYMDAALLWSQRAGMSVHDSLIEKANELGFTPIVHSP